MRTSGILMPISSLPSPYGIGTMGAAARSFVDFLVKSGQAYWQILPVCPTSYGDSPYQSFSTFAGNPYFIDLDDLAKQGLLLPEEYASIDWECTPDCINYGVMYEKRYAVLRCAAKRLLAKPGADYRRFVKENDFWLPDYALFMALKDAHNGVCWLEWEEPLRRREPAALAAARQQYADDVAFWQAVQFMFYSQWQALKHYANQQEIRIIGDLPIYVALDSVDVWSCPQEFQLDENLLPTEVAGCPPDYFSADGQLWGNPLYNWPYHKQTGYAWWIQRVRHALGIYDLLRIDHFRGFDTYWAIPADSTTAKTGKWETGPRMELFNALEGALGKLPIIAEDLGELFPSVRELLADSTFPGMKVLQFAFGGGDSEYLPHNHVKNSVVYPGTHDNTTLTAWWDESASAKEKAAAAAYLHLTGCQPTAKEVAAVKTEAARTALLRAALGSVADRAIIPMADWLGLGEEAHLNSPGKLGGNWSWRAADGFDTAALAKRILAECAVYCRT